MRAVVARRPGPPDVLEVVELPDPVAAPGQVVVAVDHAAITFIDTQLRAGNGPRPIAAEDFPVILGNGVAGIVDGTRVVTTTGGRGGYATHAVAEVADLHSIPPGVTSADAAAVLADGRTALALIRAATIAPGEVVAVTAAAVGVGGLLVQLAAAAGARVVALAGDDTKLRHARSLGAQVAASYRDPRFPDALDEIAPKLDVVFDGVGGATSRHLASRVVPGGRYVQHGAASGEWGDVDHAALLDAGVHVIPLASVANDPAVLHTLIEDALALVDEGALRPTIGQTFPLARAAEAHRAIAARQTIGKTLLTM